MGQSLTIRILPSRSRIVAGISPTFSLSRMETSRLPSRISCRASRTQFGQRESVFRGHPSVGFVFSYDFSSGLSDHLGVKDGFWLIWLAVLKTCHRPLAAIDSPFSTYFIGACIQSSPLERSEADGLLPHNPAITGKTAHRLTGTGRHGSEKTGLFWPVSSEWAQSGAGWPWRRGGWVTRPIGSDYGRRRTPDNRPSRGSDDPQGVVVRSNENSLAIDVGPDPAIH